MLPQRVSQNAIVGWVFTVNNPIMTKEQMVDHLKPHCKYVVIGDEVGELGTPHLQGYLELKKKKRFQQLLALFPENDVPHVEQRKGTPKQAADYCKKENNFLEHGSLKNNAGKRNDLVDMTDLITAGHHMRDVAIHAPATYVRNYRGLAAFQALVADAPRLMRPEMRLELYYGKTGTGKTYKAITENPDIFKKPIGKGLWFDGIPVGCKAVLIDECTGQYPLADMLQLTDKYRCQVEIKGGHAYLDVDLIILTTNIHPATWYECYKNREEQGLALCRRFTKILWFRAQDDVQEITDKRDFWDNYSDFQ